MYGPASTAANDTTKRNDGQRRPRSNIDPLVLGAILNTTYVLPFASLSPDSQVYTSLLHLSSLTDAFDVVERVTFPRNVSFE